MAQPGGRRKHSGLVPTLGGVPIVAAYLVGIGFIYWLLPPQADDALRLRGVVLGSIVIFLGGLIDDRLELPPRWQFVFQIVATVIAMSHIIFIERFTNPFPTTTLWQSGFGSLFFHLDSANPNIVVIRPFFVYIISLFWVLGMINAVNWLDGLDGLAVGVGTIAALMFALHSFRLLMDSGQTAVTLFPLALAAALLGFLRYNFAPATIFLGTAGAWLLGYNLATLSILAPAKLSTALLVMAVPILDVAWQIFDRVRRGQHPYQGDRGHLHFRLLDRGLSVHRIVLGYYTVAIVFGLVAVFVANRLLKIGLWVAVGTAVVLLLIWLTSRKKL